MRKSILIIEDNRDLLETYADAFEKSDFLVFKALNGEEGLRLALKLKPNAILLDILLPGISGYDVLMRLKKSDETMNIPIVALSNIENNEVIQDIKKLGAQFYRKTNIDIEKVIKLFTSLIEKNSNLK